MPNLTRKFFIIAISISVYIRGGEYTVKFLELRKLKKLTIHFVEHKKIAQVKGKLSADTASDTMKSNSWF